MVLQSGELIEGLFKDNMISDGRMIQRDGAVYHGSWKDGVKDGQGTQTDSIGRRYTGQWKAGLMDGKGETELPGNRKHIGEYRKGKKQGPGRVVWLDGR